MTIPVVFKGASGVNAINVVLSNEADVLPASTDGTVSDYSGSGTIIRVFEGATELDYDGIGTANGKFNVTASATGITAGAKSESGLTCVFANASNMTADNATITFTIIGKTSAGASFSLIKTQTFAKSRTGQKGDKGDQGLQGIQGTPGSDGITYYTWVRYADTPTTGMSQYPTGKSYIGFAYNKTTATESSNYADYKWSLIKGEQGIPGENGADGTQYYTWIKYADTPTSGMSDNPAGKAYIGIAVNKTTATESTNYADYTWQLTKGEKGDKGDTGLQGLQGLQGEQGIQGFPGSDGLSSYAHIAYADNSAGAGFSQNPTGKAYIGMYTDNTVTDSTDPTKYKWSLIKGADGAQGIPGAKGADGQTPYLHIAYALNATGTAGFSVIDSANKTHIGTYTDFIQADSTDPTKYKWSLIKGADGISITLVDVEFAKNTSPTTAPTTGWTTTAPTLLDGEQLWTRTKTAYSSGNPTYSSAANITPKTGATGQGIDSVTEQFILSSSKITQPAEGDVNWSTTPPTWENGKYIWSRVKVVYKNPTSTVYTGYAVSSEWEAVNNVQIGGRNLIAKKYIKDWNLVSSSIVVQGSDDDGDYLGVNQATLYNTVGGGAAYNDIFQGKIHYNEYTQYALKIRWKMAATQAYNGLGLRFKYSDGTYSEYISLSGSDTTLTEKSIISEVGKTVSGISCSYGSGANRSLIYDIQMTEGNKHTAGYSVAPEDVQAEIDAVQSNVNTVSTSVSNLNTYVTGAFKDGLIDEAEAKAIEKYKNSINESMSKAEASFLKVFANTYLEGTAKIALENAKINLWGQRDTLLTAINTAIAGGTTTPAQKTAVDNAFTSFNSLMSAFQSALEEANKAIQAKLDNLSKGYVDELEIGGRNLILNSGKVYIDKLLSGNEYGNPIVQYNFDLDVDEEKEFIFSFDLDLNYTSPNPEIRIYTTGLQGNIIPVGSRYIYLDEYFPPSDIGNIVSARITTPITLRGVEGNSSGNRISFYSIYGTGNFFRLSNFKLEKGTKATDWTPAPEDVQAGIDSAKQDASNAATAAAEAAGIANGKGDVLIQSTTPVAAMRKSTTLWIDTTGGNNTPKRWSGSAWVAVTDKTAIDAANAAVAAQNAANAAQNTANNAQLTAEQAQLAAEGYMRARYVMQWMQGSDQGDYNSLAEIKIFDKNSNNVALGKTVTGRRTAATTYPYTNITDGSINTYGRPDLQTPAQADWFQVDLGQVYYDIESIIVFGYPAGRTYYNTKTEISEDGINWTTIFDSAIEGTYKETEEGKIHTQRYASVISKLNQSKAVTDKFGTTVNGGLIQTVMMLLREFNSQQETAGISGVQGALKNNPAFWAGGTYAQASALIQFLSKMSAGTTPSSGEYSSLAKITLLHNGAAKLGDFIIEPSGRIVMVDPATGKPTLVFNVSDLPSIDDLVNNNFGGTTVSNTSRENIEVGYTLPNTISVDKDNASIEFTAGILAFSATLPTMMDRAELTVYLRRNGTNYAIVKNLTLYGPGTKSITDSISYSASGMPSGTYSIYVEIVKVGSGITTSANISASTLSWSFTPSGVRYFQFGRDGMMAFFDACHWYFSKTRGFDLRGPTNMPGAMAKGRVLSGAARDANYAWGDKYSAAGVTKISTGGYRVPVSCPDAYYSVFISPRAALRSYYLGTQTSTYFEVYFTNLSGAAVDTEFDFTVVGKNY